MLQGPGDLYFRGDFVFDKLYKVLVPRIIKRSRSYIVFSRRPVRVGGDSRMDDSIRRPDAHYAAQVMENFAAWPKAQAHRSGFRLSIFMNNVRTVFFAVAFGWLLGLVPWYLFGPTVR